MLALAKEDGSEEDMAEMIAYEVNSLSNQLKELEEKLKVFCFGSLIRIFLVQFFFFFNF